MPFIRTKFIQHWKIPEDSVHNLTATDKFQEGIRSRTFALPHLNYTFNLFYTLDKCLCFNLDVHRQEHVQVVAKYVVKVDAANIEKEKSFVMSSVAMDDGISVLSSLGINMALFKYGFLDIKVEGDFQILQPDADFNPTPKSLAASRWLDEDGKDFAIVVAGKSIKVHGWVLAVASPVFKVAVEGVRFEESQKKKIDIVDFPAQIVQIAIEFMYQRNISSDLSSKDIIAQCLAFGDKYNMKEFMDYCQIFCINHSIISDENLCEFLQLSSNFNAKMLYDFCLMLLIDGCKTKNFPGNEFLDAHVLKDFGKRYLSSFTENFDNCINDI